jgi:selenocysteine-specific elongation factor
MPWRATTSKKTEAAIAELRVVATAGHVDHGKSSLIVRLTGIDPDRWEEEKRRGLTIDLGYAWCTLPSGREIGFVDVPGHERFIRNMLAGVGPVRLVLFVVAADEGWKPQSEEHLQILDVLGAQGGVVALTKRDLVDDQRLAEATEDVRSRLAGTALEGAPILPVSSATGQGMDELRGALDEMLDAAGEPERGRPRLFVDRVFTIKGAGTIVTGTLGGDCLAVGDEVELYPTRRRARIRSLQTHKRSEDRACPVTRVAANLVGAEREELERGDVLGAPAAWRPTTTFEGLLRSVRDLAHPITPRGAFKVYAGAAEADAKVRLYEATKLEPGDEAFARLTMSRPLVLDVFDRFVLREAGRRETVGGGVVLDVAPPRRPGPDPHLRLAARRSATRGRLPGLIAAERGAITADEARLLTGSAEEPLRVGRWFVREDLLGAVERAVTDGLGAFHELHPLEEGAALSTVREAALAALRPARAPTDRDLLDTLIQHLAEQGSIVRTHHAVRLATHRVALEEHTPDVERLLEAIGGKNETSPPTVKELVAAGIDGEVIDAAARAGVVVRVSQELVLTPTFVARGESLIRTGAATGITVSVFREALGTTRKYALPMLEWFDRQGVTRREGDLRFPRVGSG